MAWLEAVAAFAVVMMVFSTLTTVALETLHRVFAIRSNGLKRLAATMYQDVVKPHLKNLPVADDQQSFIASLTTMHGSQVAADAPPRHKVSKSITSFLISGDNLDSLSTLGFVERFARTPEGRALYLESRNRGNAYMQRIVDDITGKYEALGDNATQYFQRRSRLISCLLGIVLAFALNLDVVHLFQTLLTDQSVRSELIAKGNEVQQDLQATLDDLQRTIEASEGLDQDDNLDEIRDNVRTLTSANNVLVTQQIPVGWDTRSSFGDYTGCGNWRNLGVCWGPVGLWLGWALSVLMGGLLVGLGGPFWFDVFTRVSKLVAAVRGAESTVQQAKESADRNQQPAAPGGQNASSVFETAARTNLNTYRRGRLMLNDDGSIHGNHL